MTDTCTIKITVKLNGRPPEGMSNYGKTIYESLSARRPDSGGYAMVSATGGGPTVNLFFDFLVEKDEEVVAAAEALVNAMENFGVEIVGAPDLRALRPVDPTRIEAPGVTYDHESMTLTIDTWAPDWQDLELVTFPSGKGKVGVTLAYEVGGRRIEQGGDVKTIKILRPGGPLTPPSVQ